MSHDPFAKLIRLRQVAQGPGHRRCKMVAADKHLNPNQVVHGALSFALTDTGLLKCPQTVRVHSEKSPP